MIEARELTKRYGDTAAVHFLSFTIAPGTVTGFLGPNGAGKSTTMRMIMGLDRPTSGTVTVNGKPHPAAPCPATRGRRPAGGKRRAPRPQRPSRSWKWCRSSAGSARVSSARPLSVRVMAGW